jgi:hypothetical protein
MDKFYLEENIINEKLRLFNINAGDDSVKQYAVLCNKLLEKDIENFKLRQKMNVLLYEVSLK